MHLCQAAFVLCHQGACGCTWICKALGLRTIRGVDATQSAQVDDWEECQDEDGNTYYYSASRDASQWEAPPNWKPGVKDDWEQCFDENTGHTYYYSASRNESVWEAPRAAKTPDSKRRPRKWAESGWRRTFQYV